MAACIMHVMFEKNSAQKRILVFGNFDMRYRINESQIK